GRKYRKTPATRSLALFGSWPRPIEEPVGQKKPLPIHCRRKARVPFAVSVLAPGDMPSLIQRFEGSELHPSEASTFHSREPCQITTPSQADPACRWRVPPPLLGSARSARGR